MNASNFGINADNLPKLVFDEDAGRKLLKHLEQYKMWHDSLKIMKLMYFHHVLEDHIKVPGIKEVDKPTNDNERYIWSLTHQHEREWTDVTRMIDRHVFMVVCMYASFDVNLPDGIEREVSKCGAYSGMVLWPVLSMLAGSTVTEAFWRKVNKNGINLNSMMHGSLYAADMAKGIKGLFGSRIDSMVQEGIAEGIGEKR